MNQDEPKPIGEREKNRGLKALDTRKMTFKDCRIPKANKLGADAGCNAQKLMNYTYIGIAATAVGVARAAFEYSRDYAKEREAFGEPIASRQAIAFMLAEMAIEVDATRLLTWEAAWRLDKGLDADREAYLAKQYAVEKGKENTKGINIIQGSAFDLPYKDNYFDLVCTNGVLIHGVRQHILKT